VDYVLPADPAAPHNAVIQGSPFASAALRSFLMNAEAGGPWTDRSELRNVQYRTDANLAARQSIYAYQRPRVDLPAAVLDRAALGGRETVADVGCGNGAYLAELAARGHAGPVAGLDLSAGMLAAARRRAPRAALAVADAAALPVRDGACDLALSAHMLYHVPDPRAAVRELRRITRHGGQVVVVLNGQDHLRELREAMAAALAESPAGRRAAPAEHLRLDHGADLLAAEFRSVTRHDFTADLLVPDPAPVEDYARSMMSTRDLPDADALVAAVGRVVRSHSGPFRIRTHSGCLVCR
jgi:SAM-dependent methyltransferase